MKLQLIKFNEDTGMCILELDDEAKHMLLEKGFNSLLREVLEEFIANEREKNEGV